MSKTLSLSAEAFAMVRWFARQRCRMIGAVASELIVRALEPAGAPKARNGVPVFPTEIGTDLERPPPDVAVVNRLRDPEP